MKKVISFFFQIDNPSLDWIYFFRTSISVLILIHFISILPDFDALYSTLSIVPYDVANVNVPDFLITLPKIISVFEAFKIDANSTVFLFKAIYLFLCLLLLLGFWPRISALFLLFLQIALIKTNPYYAYGVDCFTSMSLFYLILIPSNKQDLENNNITIQPYKRLFQLHVSILYFFSGFDKILGYNWWNGESVWKAIHLPFANTHFDFSGLAQNHFILIIFGWITIIIEMLYPLFVWNTKTRIVWIFATITLHLGIAFVLNLYFFSSIMIIWNLTFYYSFSQQETSKSFNKKPKVILRNWFA